MAPSLQLPVPISQEAHETAAQFAAQQATSGKGKRVYLNTLAVYAVHTYLTWLEIETELSQGDCWQPGLQAMLDVTDIQITDAGKLECRPILPGETKMVVPQEAIANRIGYVAVQFSEQLDFVQILGFARASHDLAVEPLQIPLADLLPLNTLLDVIYPEEVINDLRRWLETQAYELGWQPPETLISASRYRSTSGFRSSLGGVSPPEVYAQYRAVSRAKVNQLGRSAEEAIVLLVQVVAKTTDTIADSGENRVDICLRFYPIEEYDCLPRNLKIAVLEESGNVYLEAQPKDSDDLLELSFYCHPSEQFGIRLTLGEATVTEQFST